MVLIYPKYPHFFSKNKVLGKIYKMQYSQNLRLFFNTFVAIVAI